MNSDKWALKKMNQNFTRYISLSLLLAFSASVALCFFLPLYTDETLWRILQDRFLLDGGKLMGLIPACKSHFFISTPLTWIPFRIVDSLIYNWPFSPLFIRSLGIAQGFAFFTVFVLLVKLIYQLDTFNSLLWVIVMTGFGILPFLLSINRPENILLAGITIFSFFISRNIIFDKTSSKEKWTSVFALGFALNLVFAYHPNSLFFAPFFIGSLLLSRYHSAVKTILILFVLLLAADCIQYGIVRTTCPEVSSLDLMAGRISPLLVFSEPIKFFKLMMQNFLSNDVYLDVVLFQSISGNQWIHYFPANWGKLDLSDVLNEVLTMIFLSAILGALCTTLMRRRGKLWNLERIQMVGCFLGLSIFLFIGMNGSRAFYEGTLVVQLLLIFLTLFLEPEIRRYPLNWRSRISVALKIVVLLSLINLNYRFWPTATGIWTRPGYEVGIPFAVSLSGFAQEKEKVFSAADLCGISRVKDLNAFVTDDLTYLMYHNRMRSPLNLFFLRKRFTGKSGRMAELMRDYKSDGGVFRCVSSTSLPESERKDTILSEHEKNGYCCISAVHD